MKKSRIWLIGIAVLSMLVYTCKVTQYPVKRDAEGRILVDPHPSGAFLSPEESIKHIYPPKGYHLQLVASEPMISQPVNIVWDADGRMYVAEFITYMLDVNGTGEQKAICKIMRLEDTNGDGVMDKSTVFIDSLVLPRMMLAVGNKLLVNETYSNNIYSYEDTNGDGVADQKKLVYSNDTKDGKNLEHQKSGLIWNIDNRIYVTVDPLRYVYKNDQLVPDSMRETPGGQWGLANDDYGRMYFSLAGGEVPALNFQQNPYYGYFNAGGQLADGFMEPWPIVATPDVQGGLKRLRADSTLNHFTACTGQSIYRGDRLPADLKGDLLICEPVGRLIRRAKVTDTDGKIVLSNAYDRQEFIASTDMNFRPVNTATGPDGCLYIVDMYHGIIQESAWTGKDSYLRPQIFRKNLDKNIGRGRIYRLVSDKIKPSKTQPHMLAEPTANLVQYLSHPNGWWRDNAQKEIVRRQDKSVVPALEDLVRNSPIAIARIHALWTLNGLNALDEKLLFRTLKKDPDAEVRKSAIWISEDFMKTDNDNVVAKLAEMADDPSADVRFQLALSLRYNQSEKAQAIIKDLVSRYPNGVLAESQKTYEAELAAKEAEAKKERAMREADRLLVSQGEVIFKGLCASCHGLDGKGISNGTSSIAAPALAGNTDVNGDPRKLIAILLYGLNGPIHGKVYADAIMPAQGTNDDTYIASVLSYVRTQMGNKAKTVKADEVNKIRLAITGRTKMWTMAELDSLSKSN